MSAPVLITLHEIGIGNLIHSVIIPGYIHIVPLALILHAVPCMRPTGLYGNRYSQLAHYGIKTECVTAAGGSSFTKGTVCTTLKSNITVEQYKIVMYALYLFVIA